LDTLRVLAVCRGLTERFDIGTHILLDPQYLLHQELLTGLQGVVTIDSAGFEADVTLLAALFHVGDLGGTFSCRVPGGDAKGRGGKSRSA
jgi:hypothetical protein